MAVKVPRERLWSVYEYPISTYVAGRSGTTREGLGKHAIV